MTHSTWTGYPFDGALVTPRDGHIFVWQDGTFGAEGLVRLACECGYATAWGTRATAKRAMSDHREGVGIGVRSSD